MTAVGYAGPWGLCIGVRSADGTIGSCMPISGGSVNLGTGIAMDPVGPPSTLPRYMVGYVSGRAASLRVGMSDGSTVQVAVVRIDGQGFYLLSVPASPKIVRWAAYDAAGHRLYGGSGAPDRAG